jgi:PAS domain S-box-containing protein
MGAVAMPVAPVVVKFKYNYNRAFETLGDLDTKYAEIVRERNKALADLKESEEKFKALSDAGIEGILIHRGGKILAVNQALRDLTGYHDQAGDPDSFWDVVYPEDLKNVKRRAESGNLEAYRARLRRKDGTVFEALFRIKYVPFNGRGMCRAVIITPWLDRDDHD